MIRTLKNKWNKNIYKWIPYGYTRKRRRSKNHVDKRNKVGAMWRRMASKKYLEKDWGTGRITDIAM